MSNRRIMSFLLDTTDNSDTKKEQRKDMSKADTDFTTNMANYMWSITALTLFMVFMPKAQVSLNTPIN